MFCELENFGNFEVKSKKKSRKWKKYKFFEY